MWFIKTHPRIEQKKQKLDPKVHLRLHWVDIAFQQLNVCKMDFLPLHVSMLPGESCCRMPLQTSCRHRHKTRPKSNYLFKNLPTNRLRTFYIHAQISTCVRFLRSVFMECELVGGGEFLGCGAKYWSLLQQRCEVSSELCRGREAFLNSCKYVRTDEGFPQTNMD